MKKRTWLPKATKKATPKPKIDDDLRRQIDTDAAKVVSKLKRRCKKPKSELLNWPEDVIVRWHREALFFVAIIRTPHDRPPTFEVHIGRLEHVGDGKFSLAVPMRRGWNTVLEGESAETCLQQARDLIVI